MKNVKKILFSACIVVVAIIAFGSLASADSYVSKPIYASVNANNSYYQQLRSIAQSDNAGKTNFAYCFYRDSQFSYRLDVYSPTVFNPSTGDIELYGNVLSYVYHVPRDSHSQPYWDTEFFEFTNEFDDYVINNPYGYTYVANFFPVATGADVPPIEDTAMTTWFYQNKLYILVACIFMTLLYLTFLPKINPITKSQKGVNL